MSDLLSGAIMGGIGFIGDMVTNLVNWNQAEKERQTNIEQAQITRMREDTAIQRRVADLKAAGLSPVLAAGSAASSSPIQIGTQGGRLSPLGDSVQKAALAVMQGAQIQGILTQVKKEQAITEQIQAQTELLKAQTPGLLTEQALRIESQTIANKWADELNKQNVNRITQDIVESQRRISLMSEQEKTQQAQRTRMQVENELTRAQTQGTRVRTQIDEITREIQAKFGQSRASAELTALNLQNNINRFPARLQEDLLGLYLKELKDYQPWFDRGQTPETLATRMFRALSREQDARQMQAEAKSGAAGWVDYGLRQGQRATSIGATLMGIPQFNSGGNQ